MRPAYPKKLEVKEVSEGFRIELDTGEHFPRNEKQYYLAKNAEELLVFLMGVYDWHPVEVRDVKAQLFCCPGEEKRESGKADVERRRTDKDT